MDSFHEHENSADACLVEKKKKCCKRKLKQCFVQTDKWDVQFLLFFLIPSSHNINFLYSSTQRLEFKTRHRKRKKVRKKKRKYVLHKTCRGVTKNKSICFHFMYLFKYFPSSFFSRLLCFPQKCNEHLKRPIRKWKKWKLGIHDQKSL